MAATVMTIVSIAFQVSIAVTVFAYGLAATREDLLHVLRRPRLLVLSLLAMFVITPVAALAIELYFDFPHAARVAIVALALSPVPQLLPRTEITSGGRASYAYGLAFALALISPILIPALVFFLGDVMGRPLNLPPGTVVGVLLPTVLLPLAAGVVVRRLSSRLADRLREPLLRLSNVVLSLALVVLLILVLPAAFQVATLATLGAMAVFIAVGLAVGHLMAGPDPNDSVVLAIACANRNPGIAIAVATANFPTENFGGTVVLYAVLVSIVTKPYIRWQQRRLAAAAVAAPTPPPPARESP